MPVGVYQVHKLDAAVPKDGNIVTLCLPTAMAAFALGRGYITGGACPGDTELLIKTVAATAGDTVTLSPDGMEVNGRHIPFSVPLLADEMGRKMEPFFPGTYKVPDGLVWVVGVETRSFDSRYFGAIPVEAICGLAVPILLDKGDEK